MSAASLVRPARVEDLPQLIAMERAIADAPHWADSVYHGYVLASSSLLQRKALFVASTQGQLEGFAASSAVADEAELESIAVAETARRNGIGTRLLRVVEGWAQQQGARSLRLEVRSANGRAVAFYAAQGFGRDGRRREYYKDPVDDAMLMRLNLLGHNGRAEPATGRDL